MPEQKKYELSIGVTAYQAELTVKRDYRIMKLLKELKLDKLVNGSKEPEGFTIADYISILTESELIEKFLGEILHDENGMPFGHHDKNFDVSLFGDLPNRELEVVVEDFFTLNPTVIKLFKSSLFKMGMNTMSSLLSPSGSGVTNDSPTT